jgi:integrase
MGKKGSVSVIAEKDRGLRLRWRYQSKQYSLALGIPDSRVNRTQAEIKARLIEVDIQTGHFDQSLDKYRNREQLERKREQSGLRAKLAKRLEIQHNSADQAVLSLLEQSGIEVESLAGAESFIGWIRFTRKVKPSTLQRYLNTLKAVDPENFRHISIQQESKGIPMAYTLEQQQGILRFLKSSQEYGHYHDLVKFFLLTGCRTSEALGLQWKHVDFDRKAIYLVESLASSKDGSLIRKSTKTGKGRVFNMTDPIEVMLRERVELLGRDPEGLVFPAVRGGIIDRRNFVRRCWRACLEAVGIEWIPRQTTQYKTRHSAISRALASGVDPVAVAAQTGHDVKTLYENYAGVIRRVELPGLDEQ